MVPKINKLDIAIEYSCNLACKGCIAFSNYNRSGSVYPDIAEEWFSKWHTKINPKEIAMFGGEPLLNKDIGRLLKLVRQYWPDTTVKINTNTFNLSVDHIKHLFDIGNSILQATFHFGEGEQRNNLKHKLMTAIKTFGPWTIQKDPDDVCFLLLENKGVSIRCVQYGQFRSPAKGFGKNLRPWNSKTGNNIKICGNPTDPIMYDGRLYKCSPLANLKDTLSYHNIDHIDEWQPYLTYKGVGPDDDVQAFVDNIGKSSWMCSMCADKVEDLVSFDHLKPGAVEFKHA